VNSQVVAKGEHRLRICELFSEATVQRAVNETRTRRTSYVLKIGTAIGVPSLIGIVALFTI
jgi:hypothetical protein